MNIAIERLYNQFIQNSSLTSPVEAVARMGAMQGQDYAGAKWSVGLRVPGTTDADIEHALAEKTIVRTWVMRGTLHLVAAVDVRWLVALLGKKLISGSAARHKQLELDAATFARSSDIVTKALRDGQHMTRKALFAILEENGISTTGQRGIHMLTWSSLNGLICQGASERNDPLFMLLDEALPPGKMLARDEAIVELAGRYFISHAPVTLNDFVRWSGLTLTESRAGLAAVKSSLEEMTVDGKTYFVPRDTPPRPQHEPKIFLLPGFDEFMLGYADRSDALDPAHFNRIVPGGNGVFQSTIVIDGQVVGLWKRNIRPKAVDFTFEYFNDVSDDQRQAVIEASRPFQAFVGRA